MLRAKNLSVAVGGQRLLDDFTAELSSGTVTVIVGPNGAGKTTLLRCLDGELTPTAGGVELFGKSLADWSPRDLARARAALPQKSSLDFPFSVADVVLMGRMPHADDNRALAEKVLRWCDCEHLSARAYTTLSGGEQQRVQIARVLAQVVGGDGGDGGGDGGDGDDGDRGGGRFLLLDEPAAALDLNHQYALLRLLKKLAGDGVGVVATLHDLNLVAQFADRALILDRGMLVADGAPLEVFTDETLSAVFNLDIKVRRHPDDPATPLIVPRVGGC